VKIFDVMPDKFYID